MTRKQAVEALRKFGTPEDRGKIAARDLAVAGVLDRFAAYDFGRLFGARWERGFRDFAEAWKTVQI